MGGGEPDLFIGNPALARRSDPDTSKNAAASLNTTDLEKQVLEVIRGFGPQGCIADEVIAAFPARSTHTITPRFKPLLAKGFIEDTGERRKGSYGRSQRVVRAKT